jgi:hypothetical protein
MGGRTSRCADLRASSARLAARSVSAFSRASCFCNLHHQKHGQQLSNLIMSSCPKLHVTLAVHSGSTLRISRILCCRASCPFIPLVYEGYRTCEQPLAQPKDLFSQSGIVVWWAVHTLMSASTRSNRFRKSRTMRRVRLGSLASKFSPQYVAASSSCWCAAFSDAYDGKLEYIGGSDMLGAVGPGLAMSAAAGWSSEQQRGTTTRGTAEELPARLELGYHKGFKRCQDGMQQSTTEYSTAEQSSAALGCSVQ